MYYFRFTADTPYRGTENFDYRKFEKRPTDAELNEMAEEYGMSNAGRFEHLATGWYGENLDIETLKSYYAECTSTWEEITEEEYFFRGLLTN